MPAPGYEAKSLIIDVEIRKICNNSRPSCSSSLPLSGWQRICKFSSWSAVIACACSFVSLLKKKRWVLSNKKFNNFSIAKVYNSNSIVVEFGPTGGCCQLLRNGWVITCKKFLLSRYIAVSFPGLFTQAYIIDLCEHLRFF